MRQGDVGAINERRKIKQEQWPENESCRRWDKVQCLWQIIHPLRND